MSQGKVALEAALEIWATVEGKFSRYSPSEEQGLFWPLLRPNGCSGIRHRFRNFGYKVFCYTNKRQRVEVKCFKVIERLH